MEWKRTRFNRYGSSQVTNLIVSLFSDLFHEQESVFFTFHPFLETSTQQQFPLEVASSAPENNPWLLLSSYSFHYLQRWKTITWPTEKVKLENVALTICFIFSARVQPQWPHYIPVSALVTSADHSGAEKLPRVSYSTLWRFRKWINT